MNTFKQYVHTRRDVKVPGLGGEPLLNPFKLKKKKQIRERERCSHITKALFYRVVVNATELIIQKRGEKKPLPTC